VSFQRLFVRKAASRKGGFLSQFNLTRSGHSVSILRENFASLLWRTNGSDFLDFEFKSPGKQDSSWRSLAPSGLVCVYAVLLLPIYCLPVYSPDEIWFAQEAQRLSNAWNTSAPYKVVLEQQNHLGYGAIYWIGYSLLAKVTSEPIWVVRALALVANLSIPVCLLRSIRNPHQPAALIAMLLWLSFTAAWWSGKVTGPELFSTALCFLGLFGFQRAKSILAVLTAGSLMGLAVGLKLNALPAILAVLFIFPQLPNPKRMLFVALLGIGLGFVIANPFILSSSESLFGNIPNRGKPGITISTKRLLQLFWNADWEWDAVYRGGYFNWGLCPFVVPIYFVFLWKCKLPIRWIIGGVACTVIGFLLFLTSRTYQGWYWLPLLTLFPLTVLQVKSLDSTARRWAIAVILINALGNAPWIGMQYYSKLEHFAQRHERRLVIAEAETIASSNQNEILVTIIGPKMHHDISKVDQNDRNAKHLNNLDGVFLLYDLLANRIELPPGETCLVIHERRLRRYNSVIAPGHDEQRLGSDYEIQMLDGEYVSSLRIHRRSHNFGASRMAIEVSTRPGEDRRK
jgi:hypothetical protein